MLKDSRSCFFSCKIQVGGQRELFPLRTANKSSAASKTAVIFRDVVALGWEPAIAKHKPTTEKRDRMATVGDLLSEIRATAGFRLSTYTVYSQSLRQIVSEIAGIGDQPALGENGEPKCDGKKRIIYLPRHGPKGGRIGQRKSKPDPNPDLLSPEEAAALLGVHPITLRRYRHQGKLAAYRLPGGLIRYQLAKQVPGMKRNGRTAFTERSGP